MGGHSRRERGRQAGPGSVKLWDATVGVLLGNGNGTFQSQQTYPTGNQYSGYDTVAIGDVNGDGKPDIVVNNYYDSTITVLISSGSGTFTPQSAFPVNGNPTSVALGDLNGDGKLDLAISNQSYSTTVAFGNGDGTFKVPITYGTGTSNAWAAMADFNGDGRLDIVFTSGNYPTSTSTVLLNSVTQSATLTGVTLPGVTADNVTAVYAGDTHYTGGVSNALLLPSNKPIGHTVLTVTPSSGAVGTIYTLTATATDNNSNPVTSGAVTFYDGTKAIATIEVVSATGIATFKTADFVVGTHSLTATFNGLDTLKPSTSAVKTITVTGKNPSATHFSASGVEGSYVLNAVVDGFGYGAPSGSVVFEDTTTSTTLGNVALSSANSVSGFLPAVSYGVGTDANQVIQADVNNDGKLDLVVGNYYGTESACCWAMAMGHSSRHRTSEP